MWIAAAAACWSAVWVRSSLGSVHLASSPLQLMQHSSTIPVWSMACISLIFTRRWPFGRAGVQLGDSMVEQ
jgi:hypothetical protein